MDPLVNRLSKSIDVIRRGAPVIEVIEYINEGSRRDVPVGNDGVSLVS